ncbi:MAG: hypothetical protein AB8E15_06050 [Bdellovibrionales bacterium]
MRESFETIWPEKKEDLDRLFDFIQTTFPEDQRGPVLSELKILVEKKDESELRLFTNMLRRVGQMSAAKDVQVEETKSRFNLYYIVPIVLILMAIIFLLNQA